MKYKIGSFGFGRGWEMEGERGEERRWMNDNIIRIKSDGEG